jgi:D-cysteine desulfhydrase family pyridoxal phosphate-dependent enzyme
MSVGDLRSVLDRFPRVHAAQTPTVVEPMSNLGRDLGITLAIKRDDCTGVGFGGNKIRQLEFYFGAALAGRADTVVITGAVQSNFTRATAAMARRFGLDCHIQLEERVPDVGDQYRASGNVLLSQLLGATLHSFPEGENEASADHAVVAIADELRGSGRRPYVIPLGPGHPPLGALGYVAAALELAEQINAGEQVDHIVVASGSGATHTGLLFGLRVLGLEIPVSGICVRRAASLQRDRIARGIEALGQLTGLQVTAASDDVRLHDGSLAPGYGRLNPATVAAIRRTAEFEGQFLDPVYTGRAMAGLIQLAEAGELGDKRVLFWHTGGQPALFAYGDQLIGMAPSPDPSRRA